MKLFPLANLVLTAMLVLLSPLESLRCTCASTGSAAHAAPKAAACHKACCRAAAEHAAASHGGTSRAKSCDCAHLTAAAPSAVAAAPDVDAPVVTLAVIATLAASAPPARTWEIRPAPDVGKPLPVLAGAHGLRAPPALA